MRGLTDPLAAWPGESEFSCPWGPRRGETLRLWCGASSHWLSRLRGSMVRRSPRGDRGLPFLSTVPSLLEGGAGKEGCRSAFAVAASCSPTLAGERGAGASSTAGDAPKGPSVPKAASAYPPRLVGGREREGGAISADETGSVPETADADGGALRGRHRRLWPVAAVARCHRTRHRRPPQAPAESDRRARCEGGHASMARASGRAPREPDRACAAARPLVARGCPRAIAPGERVRIGDERGGRYDAREALARRVRRARPRREVPGRCRPVRRGSRLAGAVPRASRPVASICARFILARRDRL